MKKVTSTFNKYLLKKFPSHVFFKRQTVLLDIYYRHYLNKIIIQIIVLKILTFKGKPQLGIKN